MTRTVNDSRLLVADVLDGRSAAFETLVGLYEKLVSHIVFRMVANPVDREDICQEVFIKVYQNLAGFNFDAKLSTWIARIAYNTGVNHLAKKRIPLLDDMHDDGEAMQRYPGTSDTPEQLVEKQDVSDRVHREIERLPVLYRAVLTMYHLDEMTYEEIARVTDLPMGTVKSHLFRARRLLKERLTKKYQLEDIWR